MSSEAESESRRILTPPVIVLIVLFVAFLFMTLCVLSVLFLGRQRAPSPTLQSESSDLIFPVEPPLKSLPNASYAIHLPVILTGSAPVRAPVVVSPSAQVWIVTKIKLLGYRSGKHRYDLATFRRVEDQATAKAYCINPGWETPRTGTQYQLTSDGTFIPLQDPQGDRYQRFMRLP